MKQYIWYALGAVAVLMWSRGRKVEESESIVEAGMHQDGSNWMGSMWDRLGGLDLTYSGYGNIGPGAPADVDKVTLAQISVPGWPN